jgi:hypothetical protein
MSDGQFSIENRNSYLLITLAPYSDMDEFKSNVTQIKDAIDLYKCRKLLIDATATKERIPVLDLFEICLHMVDKLGPANPKIAVFVVPEATYPDRFGENVVRNRGMDLMRFVSSIQEALDWLEVPVLSK